MDKNSAVVVAVLITFFVCAWLFRQKEEPSEVGRYVWGRSGLTVLDTTDGTVYVVDGLTDKLTLTEIHTPTGLAWRRKHEVLDLIYDIEFNEKYGK